MIRVSGEGTHQLSLSALRKLRSYSWPGNVRELHNVVHSPSPTPGVSIRGVGVASSASVVNVIGGYERLFIGFFSNGGAASVATFPSRFISKIDGYQYKQSEVSCEHFLHSTRKPAQGSCRDNWRPRSRQRQQRCWRPTLHALGRR